MPVEACSDYTLPKILSLLTWSFSLFQGKEVKDHEEKFTRRHRYIALLLIPRENWYFYTKVPSIYIYAP